MGSVSRIADDLLTSEDLLDFLDDVREEVESGEVRALMVALVHQEDSVSTRWAVMGGTMTGSIVGAATLLFHRVLSRFDKDS